MPSHGSAVPSFPDALQSHFEPLRLLGRGGFGSVWLARQKALLRLVAVKTIHEELLDSEEQRGRFLDEARLTARVRHPGIVTLLDHGIDEGVPWMAFEYVDGPSLRARLDAGPLPWRDVVQVGLQIALALEEARGHGVIHRDVKPDNILQAQDGRYLITDFGIARWAGNRTKTADGMILGTPAYVSPQQIKGHLPAHQSDLYALGVTLFELLTGRLPFAGDTGVAILEAHLTREPPDVLEMAPETPPALAAIVRRLLAKPRPERFDTATEVAQELARLLQAEAPRPSSGRFSRKSSTRALARPSDAASAPDARRSPRFFAAAALAATLLAGAYAAFRTPAAPPVASAAVASPAPAPPAADLAELEGFLQSALRTGARLSDIADRMPVDSELLATAAGARLASSLDELTRAGIELVQVLRRANTYRGPALHRLLELEPVLDRLVDVSGRQLRGAVIVGLGPGQSQSVADLVATLRRVAVELQVPHADPYRRVLSQLLLPSIDEVASKGHVQHESTRSVAAWKAASALDAVVDDVPGGRALGVLICQAELLGRLLRATAPQRSRGVNLTPDKIDRDERAALEALVALAQPYARGVTLAGISHDKQQLTAIVLRATSVIAADRSARRELRVQALSAALELAPLLTREFVADTGAWSRWVPRADTLRESARELGVALDARIDVLESAR